MPCHQEWRAGEWSNGDVASENEPLQARVEVGMAMEEKSGGVEGELASDPWSDVSEGVRRMLREKDGDEGDEGEVDGWVAGRR